MNNPKILIVDDEPKLVRLLSEILQAAGFQVHAASSGAQALIQVIDYAPDLVILDIVLLGELDGYEVARRLREVSRIPIIMLTARIREDEMLRGFEAGVDDYITKPFSARELLARVRAVLKRAGGQESHQVQTSLNIGDLQIDLVSKTVKRDGCEIHLTPTEYSLLNEFSQNPDRVIPKVDLLSAVWGSEYRDDEDYLRAYIHLLRKKLESDPSNPSLIISSPGIGYMLVTK